MKVFENIFCINFYIFYKNSPRIRREKHKKFILTEDALTISEEGAGALTRQLVLQGLETFTFFIDNKKEW